MSPHTALRLAARPLRGVRGATILDRLDILLSKGPANTLITLTRRTSTSHLPICIRCSIILRRPEGRARLFSTAPRPPKEPSSTLGSSPETATTPDDTASASASPVSPTPQEPEPSTSPSSSSSSTSSESSPPPSPEKNNSSTDRSLPSFTENHRHPWSARFSTFMDNLQSRALTATQTINDLTGYSAIEAIKRRNGELEVELAAAQQRLRSARHNYKSLTSHRAATQREVTTLLARKDTWTPADLERFTTLYRMDHELEAQVAGAAAELTEAETDEARLSNELNAGILKRYHEEQIWSDRIRRQSTWGTWGLMGVNVVLFLVLQFVAEPWKRKRLVRGIAESEQGFLDEVRRELAEVKAVLEASGLKQQLANDAAAEKQRGEEERTGVADADISIAATPAELEVIASEEQGPRKSWREYWSDPALVTAALRDLYSDRRADLRMRDVSVIALESAVASATVVATIAFAVLRNSRS
ncbi:hypothetical protein N656DRAFT_781115 [Canariomyces notabilis]|uniref:Sensitive to high expression protein 9, mitochondrial n=1 Tax=Canariomyces notabilis TaxID=2074819 RepID=A0AAN6QMC1_9PEZI|nr:hypothetical protein N656DRAFT_781115 [Canariomyces arenarius]